MSAPEPGPVEGREPAQGTRRYPRTFQGLVASLIVMVLLGLGIWGISRLEHHDTPDPAPAIDWKPLVEELRQSPPDGFAAIVAPDDLPEDWKVTSARVSITDLGPTWEMGMVTPSGEFLGLAQAAGTDSADLTEGLERLHDDTIITGGQSWSGTDAAHPGGDSAYVIYGSATAAEAQVLSDALR